MLIGVPPESQPGETRVAATPATVAQLRALGYEVVVGSGAGGHSSYPDEAYAESGARIGTAAEAWAADVVVHVNAPTADELASLADGATLISLLAPMRDPEMVEALGRRPITALAMDA